MQSDVQASAIRNFQETRDDFVAELEKFSGGDTGGRVVPPMQSFLRRIHNTLSMWTLIRGDQEKEGKCFDETCRNLMVMMVLYPVV